MNQEQKIIESFRRAKSDIIKLQNQIIDLSKKQEQLIEMIMNIKGEETELAQKVKDLKKTNGKRKQKEYVASKEGKNFHIPECPFAHNIKPKTKIHFQSTTKALNEGYKPCECTRK